MLKRKARCCETKFICSKLHLTSAAYDVLRYHDVLPYFQQQIDNSTVIPTNRYDLSARGGLPAVDPATAQSVVDGREATERLLAPERYQVR